MHGLLSDVRYALRAMRRDPGFTAIAVFCLAAAIGVNATAFSMLDALMFRSLPWVVRQGEINAVLVSSVGPWGRSNPALVSTRDWEMFRGAIPAFASSAVTGHSPVALRMGGEPLAVRADFVSGDFFAMLGTLPSAGRLLSGADDTPGAPPVVVISDVLWNREFDRRDVVGEALYVGNVAFTIVGVAPKGFVGLYPGELGSDPRLGAPLLFLPVAQAPLVRVTSRYASVAAELEDDWLLFAGRRRPGATARDVEVQADQVAARIAAMYPDARREMTAVARAPSTASPAETVGAVVFTMALPLLILLVACANLANQLLARAVQRGREIAVRLSLGASRARLVRQLMVESTLLAVVASGVGVLLARALTDVIGTMVLVMPFRVPIDLRVMVFTVALALVTALAFGLVPALRATRMDLAQAVKEGGGAGGYRRSRLRNALVMVQVAASVTLLALAGVFGRASQRSAGALSVEEARSFLTVRLDLNLLGYAADAGRAFQARAMERLAGVPGVDAVALAPFGPAGGMPVQRVSVAGDAPERRRWEYVAAVQGDWFAVRDLRAVAGRLFTPAEARGGVPVAVVDEVTAAALWPNSGAGGAGAVGQTLRISEEAIVMLAGQPPMAEAVVTVIGVVPALPEPRMEEPEGLIIVPPTGAYHARVHFYVRTRGDAAQLKGSVVAALRELDPRLPFIRVATLGESFATEGESVAQIASGVGVMGGIAVLLAALGLWAVLSFVVAQRRYEIGVRIALGARSTAVTWMVVRQSLVLTAIGVVVGTFAAGATATVMRGILFGLPPLDPLAFGGSSGLILVVALVASAGPARRAAAVDPMVALRAE